MRATHRRLREFEALRALIASGTTVGAARRIGVSQSAISRTLSQLEERTGRTLFVRSPGRIQPTPEAYRLNEMLDPLFDAVNAIDHIDWSATDKQPLRLVAPQTQAQKLLIPCVAKYLKRYPGQKIELDIKTTDVVISGILDSSYDLGLSSGNIQNTGVTYVPWRQSKVVCLLPLNHPLSEKTHIEPGDLHGMDMVDFLGTFGTRALTNQILSKTGVRPNIVVETTTAIAALELVRQGVGLALVNPFPLLSGEESGIAIKQFDAPVVYQTNFVLPKKRKTTDAARHFMRFVQLTTEQYQYSEDI